MTKQYKDNSDVAQKMHRLAARLHSAGAYSNEQMTKWNDLCLEFPPTYRAKEIKNMRANLRLSQSEFAQLLPVSVKTIQAWEQGQKTPSPLASKLLQLIEHRGLSGVLLTGQKIEHSQVVAI